MDARAEFSAAPCGVVTVAAERISAAGERRDAAACEVVQEDVLTLEVEQIGSYALMWTPTEAHPGATGYTAEDGVLADAGTPEALALAAGFAFTEGIVDALSDIAAMWVCPERPDVVNLRLADPERVAPRRRNVVVNSSCGICGGREQLAGRMQALPPVDDALRLTLSDLAAIRDEMQGHQLAYSRTGGTHAAALFDASLRIVAIAEDLGRHNALDKVIGYGLLGGSDLRGCGAFLSSRASYEMVAKAVRARLALLAAISAPSSMAVELAARQGITLCGFVREDRATVYTHPQRIT